MALKPGVLGSWAKGAKADSMTEDELDAETEAADDDAGGGDDQDPVWSGQVEEPSQEEADAFVTWLEENEPEIYDGLVDLSSAVINADDAMLEHAKQELGKAEQVLTPEYEKLTPEQCDAIASALELDGIELNTPEWALALAKAVATGRATSGEGDEEEEEEDDEELEDEDDGFMGEGDEA